MSNWANALVGAAVGIGAAMYWYVDQKAVSDAFVAWEAENPGATPSIAWHGGVVWARSRAEYASRLAVAARSEWRRVVRQSARYTYAAFPGAHPCAQACCAIAIARAALPEISRVVLAPPAASPPINPFAAGKRGSRA